MAHTRESRAHVYMYLHHLREYTPSSIGDLKQDISKYMHDSIFGLQSSNIWNC